MKIAAANQNRKEITGDTGRCGKFWIYQIENDAINAKELPELPKEQSFHESSPMESSPLDQVQQVLIAGLANPKFDVRTPYFEKLPSARY